MPLQRNIHLRTPEEGRLLISQEAKVHQCGVEIGIISSPIAVCRNDQCVTECPYLTARRIDRIHRKRHLVHLPTRNAAHTLHTRTLCPRGSIVLAAEVIFEDDFQGGRGGHLFIHA